MTDYSWEGIMEKTKEALRILITGESNAVKMYEAFSKKAKDEGYSNIALLFEVLSKAERIHIKNHVNALDEKYTPELDDINIQSTEINLKTAYLNEREEGTKLYPELVKYIKKECSTEYGKVARLSMLWAQKVEREHARIIKRALKSLERGRDFPIESIYLCQVCGNIVINDLKEQGCDVCGHDHQFFKMMVKD
jgi:rubrerythrin